MAQDWRRALLKSMGAPVTTRNLQFLNSWQAREGGHTNNDARFNWLNTTRDAPGATGEINSVGVKSFDTFGHGIGALAATLGSGRYGDIVKGLRGGDPYKEKPSAGLSTWVSGSPTANLGYSAKVLGMKPEEIRTKAGQAYNAGPAAIVNNPSPSQALAFQHQKVATLLQMSANTISGDPSSNWQLIQGLQQAQAELQQSNIQAVQAESESRQYGGTTAPAGPTGRTFEGATDTMKKILQIADAQVGKPYVWGAETPQEGGFDCSGLLDWAFKQAGVKLPGRLTTYTAAKMGISVKGKPYKPGDWIITKSGGHMVMYVGNGQVIAAPRTGERVQYQPVSKFENNVGDVRRVLK